jgi:hypothetical protein
VAPHTVDAIRVAGLVARALAAAAGLAPACASSLGEREHGDGAGERELRITATAAPLAALLADSRFGRVVLDATAPPDAALLRAAAGLPADAQVVTRRIAVADGAPIDRIFLPWAHATRRACLRDGAPVWDEVRGPLVEGLRLVGEGLAHGARVLAVSWRPVAEACARGEADPEVLAELAELAARGITVEWAHFGATRGIDRWRDCAAVLALGSPWPDASAVAEVCRVAGLAPEASGAVGRHIAAAELAQVIGRLRAPRRSTAARLVVLASLPPLGADARWTVRELASGRPRLAVDLAPGASRAAQAALAGVSASTVARRRREGRRPHGGVSEAVTEASVTPSDTPPCVGPPPTRAPTVRPPLRLPPLPLRPPPRPLRPPPRPLWRLPVAPAVALC